MLIISGINGNNEQSGKIEEIIDWILKFFEYQYKNFYELLTEIPQK